MERQSMFMDISLHIELVTHDLLVSTDSGQPSPNPSKLFSRYQQTDSRPEQRGKRPRTARILQESSTVEDGYCHPATTVRPRCWPEPRQADPQNRVGSPGIRCPLAAH